MPPGIEEPLPWPDRGIYAITPEGLTGPDLAAAVASAAQNLPPLLASGIDLLAIVNAILGAPDIGAAARRLVRLFS